MPTWSTVICIAAFGLTLSTAVVAVGSSAGQGDVFDRVTHGTAVSEGGVKIHYASLGKGPLVVMIHGFPDYWYTWRKQMEGLADKFQVVGNGPDKPVADNASDTGRAKNRRTDFEIIARE